MRRQTGRFGMRAAIGLRHPASASCLERHLRLAGRCPNNSSLFPPLAAVVVVALCAYSAERIFIISRLQRRFLRKRSAVGERLLPLGGAVAQRLRGFESAEPEKTVKRSSRRTGVNLQFFPVQPSSLGLKGASSPFFVAPARRNRWWFSGSLLPPKENIPRLPPPTPQRCNCRFFSTLSVKNQPGSSAELPG